MFQPYNSPQKLAPYHNTVNVQHLPHGVYGYRLGEVWGMVVIQ